MSTALALRKDDRQIAHLTIARQALSKASSLKQVQQIADLARAAEIFAQRQKLSDECLHEATSLRISALDKLGEMLEQLKKQDKLAKGRVETGPRGSKSDPRAATLVNLGIDKHQADQARKIHAMPAHLKERVVQREIKLSEALKPESRVSHNSGDFEWYTPAPIIRLAQEVMGGIDLDPASCETANKIVKATRFYSQKDDGLAQPWKGRVWMNPPYASELVIPFAKALTKHLQSGDVTQAMVLVNNATETQWFSLLVQEASAICFPQGRVKFWKKDNVLAAPVQGQAVIYFGSKAKLFAQVFKKMGKVWFA